MKKQLCDELMLWRHSQKRTQTEIADALGISQSTYHKWESNKCEIPIQYYLKISKLIGVDLQEYIPEDLNVFIPDLPNNPSETVQFSALEMLKVIEQNNQLLREKVKLLEQENAELKRENRFAYSNGS
jgi:transcriptional regulator with XRE-family HTH domain